MRSFLGRKGVSYSSAAFAFNYRLTSFVGGGRYRAQWVDQVVFVGLTLEDSQSNHADLVRDYL